MLDAHTSDPASSSDRINIVANWEVNYWATRWGVSPEELLGAVAQVGDNVRVVQAYIAQQRELA
jgi:hypothetical protein